MSQQRGSFGKPDRSKRRLKVLLIGKPKSGKTRAALTFPRVALIDSEGGWEFIEDVAPEGVSQTKDIDGALALIAQIEADGGKSYDTLVLDSITVLYQVELFRRRQSLGEKFGFSDRAFINDRMQGLYNALTQLPVHVVVIAREDDQYVSDGARSLRRVGTKADADKSVLYPFDFVIQMGDGFTGTVIETRGQALPKGYQLKTVTYEFLAATLLSDDLRNVQEARAFFTHWKNAGMSQEDILAALAVDKISQWTQGRAAADAAVERFRTHGKPMPGTPPPDVQVDETGETVIVEPPAAEPETPTVPPVTLGSLNMGSLLSRALHQHLVADEDEFYGALTTLLATGIINDKTAKADAVMDALRRWNSDKEWKQEAR